ncbi:MAG: sulfatase/phosphatase domain-containing protein, partial [Halobacteriaceae archaeon]
HIFCLYDTLIHVPLIVSPPTDTTAVSSIDEQVSLVDLHPTFLDAAGGSPQDYPYADTLLPIDDPPVHEYTFSEYAGYDGPIQRLNRRYPAFDTSQFARSLQSIRGEEYKLIVGSDGTTELYEWREDPHESTDRSEASPDVVAELRGELSTHLDQLDDRGALETIDDPAVEQQLRELGYL